MYVSNLILIRSTSISRDFPLYAICPEIIRWNLKVNCAIFGLSVNPIPTREGRLCLPGFSNLPTALQWLINFRKQPLEKCEPWPSALSNRQSDHGFMHIHETRLVFGIFYLLVLGTMKIAKAFINQERKYHFWKIG